MVKPTGIFDVYNTYTYGMGYTDQYLSSYHL
jgi:hypothetical protein